MRKKFQDSDILFRFRDRYSQESYIVYEVYQVKRTTPAGAHIEKLVGPYRMDTKWIKAGNKSHEESPLKAIYSLTVREKAKINKLLRKLGPAIESMWMSIAAHAAAERMLSTHSVEIDKNDEGIKIHIEIDCPKFRLSEMAGDLINAHGVKNVLMILHGGHQHTDHPTRHEYVSDKIHTSLRLSHEMVSEITYAIQNALDKPEIWQREKFSVKYPPEDIAPAPTYCIDSLARRINHAILKVSQGEKKKGTYSTANGIAATHANDYLEIEVAALEIASRVVNEIRGI